MQPGSPRRGRPVVMVPYAPESVESVIAEFMRDPVKYDGEDVSNWKARLGEWKPTIRR